MGRSYEIKEGRKVIIPTKKQVESMERKQAAENTLIDALGRTGMVNTVSDIKMIEAYIKTLGLSQKQQKEILENARATDEFIQLNVLRILKALRDGDTKNEMEDKKFKFSLDNLIKKWANSEVELMASYDKNGKFLGYDTQANSGIVYMTTGAGQLVGGTTIHTHPVLKGEFFGGNFSIGDWQGFRDTGERRMVVTSKEGTYILEKSKPLKLTNSDITKSYVRTLVRINLSQKGIKDDKTTKFGCSKSELALWRDKHHGAKEIAAIAGVKFTFIPNKGFEGLDK